MRTEQGTNAKPFMQRAVRSLSHAGAALTIAAALGVIVTGCGTTDPGNGDEVTTTTQPLGETAWRHWGQVDRLIAPFAIHDEPPTVCANNNLLSMVGVRRKSDNKYYFTALQTYVPNAWQVFEGGSPDDPQGVAFASPPTCTHLAPFRGEPYPSPNLLLLAGKDANNKIRVLLGTAGGDPSANLDNPVPPPSPTVNGQWSNWGTLGSSFSYTGDDGSPALTTSGSRVVLTFRARATVNGQPRNRIYVHHRRVPFSSTAPWSDRVTAPDLPATVTAAGIPSVAYMTDAENNVYDNKFVIVVRVEGNALAWILLGISSSGVVTWGSWNISSVPYAGVMTSDPVVEWDPTTNEAGTRHPFLSLYYRVTSYSDNQTRILNHSVPDPGEIGNYPFTYMPSDGFPTFIGAPRATYGGGVEVTNRMVVARGHTSTTPIADRDKSIIMAQDIPRYYEVPPGSPFVP